MPRTTLSSLRYSTVDMVWPSARAGEPRNAGGSGVAPFVVQAETLAKSGQEASEASVLARRRAELVARIEERTARTLTRTAMDLTRLEDLDARAAQREALRLRQQWFVLGRVVERAMQSDADLERRICALLTRAGLNQQERALFGLASRRRASARDLRDRAL